MGNSWLKLLGVTAVTVSLALACSAGCKRKKEYNGIGKWILGETMLKEWGYTCQPSGAMTWCQANPLEPTHVLSLGGQSAEVGALFDGSEPASKLVELALEVSGCNVDSLKRWLESEFGEPSEDRGDHQFWSGKYAFIAAKVPSAHVTCEILMVDPDDSKRVAELEAEAGGK